MANRIMVVEHIGEIDLLQQALAGASDDLIETSSIEEQQVLDQIELLNILQGDETDSQTIQLTAEQAAALGLRLEVDPIKEEACDISNTEGDVNEIQTGAVNNIVEVNAEGTFENRNTQIIVNNSNKNVPSIATKVIKNITINPSKPLGTTQNPIQLIHQNGILKSVQQLTPEQISDIKNVLQNSNIGNDLKTYSEKMKTNYNPETKTRITYRTIFPEDLDLQTPRRGRPSLKRGRKPKSERPVEREPSPDVPIAKPIRTRSGRITKPPRHKNFRPLREIDVDNSVELDNDVENNILSKTVKETKSFARTNKKVDEEINDQIEEKNKFKDDVKTDPVLLSGLPQNKRPISAQFRCPTCKKAYVGYSRIERHLKLFPDHGPLPIKRKTVSLWQTTLKMARSAPRGSRGLTLLNDLQSLINSLQKITSTFLQPIDSVSNESQNKNASQILDINNALAAIFQVTPGKYIINESALFDTEKKILIENISSESGQISENTEIICNGKLSNLLSNNTNNATNIPVKTVNLVLPLTTQETVSSSNTLHSMAVDTGQVQDVAMCVDTNMITNDEIINDVDQLVNERLDSFTAPELAPLCSSQEQPNTTLTSPNGSTQQQALSLDLSLDLFHFHPS